MMKRLSVLTYIAVILLTFSPYKSNLVFAEIVQPQLTPQYGFGLQILSLSPIGQTFTAEDIRIASIGFAIFDMNPQLPIVPINVELFEGEGTGGNLLGTMPLQTSSDPLSLPGHLLPAENARFLEADFSFATLDVGQVYTALLTSSNGRAGVYGEYWKSDIDGSFLQPDLYTGGYGFSQQSLLPNYKAEFDYVFRVTPVPEPGTVLLLGLGGLMLRKKRSLK